MPGRKNWPCGARNKATPPRPEFLPSKAESGASRPRFTRLRGCRNRRYYATPRRTSPPWYGFKGNLAIAAQLGIATPSIRRLKRLRPARRNRTEAVGDKMSDQAILVTGAAGFIGFHVARGLLAEGRQVVGLDNLNHYYDPDLKRARLNILREYPEFSFAQTDLADRPSI